MADLKPSGITREFHGDSADILAALEDILASASFANADRLKSFLDYVVTEAVNGRSDAIRGKTIALDVYDRNAATDGDPENVVRVDARRLRRRLAEYYASEGKNARVRIHIDSGGYAPRFEWIEAGIPAAPVLTNDRKQAPGLRRLIPSRPHIVIAGLATGFAVLFIAGYLLLFAPSNSGPAVFPDTKAMERQALLEKSPATLQAVNTAEQARLLMNPLSDAQRQKLALGFFEHAQSLDPDYYGGYAGAAQAVGTLALLSNDADVRARLQTRSLELAAKATDLSPTAPWSQAASAWAHFVNRNYDDALRYAERAYAMVEGDSTATAAYGVIALVSGDYELARSLTDPNSATALLDQKLGTRNTYAIANYFLGNHAAVLEAFRTAAEEGEAISPLNILFEIASLHALGQRDAAQRKLQTLQEHWAIEPLEKVLKRAFKDPGSLDEVFERLVDLGWVPPARQQQPAD